MCVAQSSEQRKKKRMMTIRRLAAMTMVAVLIHPKRRTIGSEIEILPILQGIQSKINVEYKFTNWSTFYDGTQSFQRLADRFLGHNFSAIIGNENVFVYDFITYSDNYVGNRLGNYFEAIACADVADLHFVCLTSKSDANKIASALPTIRIHPNPAKNRSEAVANVRQRCTLNNNNYPWENPSSLQFSHPTVIQDTLGPAIDQYINTTHALTCPAPSTTSRCVPYSSFR